MKSGGWGGTDVKLFSRSFFAFRFFLLVGFKLQWLVKRFLKVSSSKRRGAGVGHPLGNRKMSTAGMEARIAIMRDVTVWARGEVGSFLWKDV